MTGGLAFVLDPEDQLPERYNPTLVELCRVEDQEDENLLKSMVLRHAELTASPKAKEILAHWEKYLSSFWKVQPKGNVVALEAASGSRQAKTP